MVVKKLIIFFAALPIAVSAFSQTSGEDIENTLLMAIKEYGEGDYQSAVELLESAIEHLEISHTARDREMIFQTIDNYFFHILNDEFDKAVYLLSFPDDGRRGEKHLRQIYDAANENGIAVVGITVLEIRFDAPETASADILVMGTGDETVEATLRLIKPYIALWQIDGYPASADKLIKLLPLVSHGK